MQVGTDAVDEIPSAAGCLARSFRPMAIAPIPLCPILSLEGFPSRNYFQNPSTSRKGEKQQKAVVEDKMLLLSCCALVNKCGVMSKVLMPFCLFLIMALLHVAQLFFESF